jgi:hypothetical protein
VGRSKRVRDRAFPAWKAPFVFIAAAGIVAGPLGADAASLTCPRERQSIESDVAAYGARGCAATGNAGAVSPSLRFDADTVTFTMRATSGAYAAFSARLSDIRGEILNGAPNPCGFIQLDLICKSGLCASVIDTSVSPAARRRDMAIPILIADHAAEHRIYQAFDRIFRGGCEP